MKQQKAAVRAKPVTRGGDSLTYNQHRGVERGRPRIVSTEQVVAALDSSVSLREAAKKLGVWHGAITNRRESMILDARRRMKMSRRRRKGLGL